MRYGTKTHISPANINRTKLVQDSLAEYDKEVRIKHHESVKAAGFEVYWYFKKAAGKPCSCLVDVEKLPANEALDENGELKAEYMRSLVTKSAKLGGILDTTYTLGAVGLTEDGQEGHSWDEEELDDPEDVRKYAPDDDSVPIYWNTHSPRSVNCPVCNLTGFIGGFDPYNSTRIVISTMDLFLDDCDIGTGEFDRGVKPWEVKITDKFADLSFKATLPRNPKQVVAWRVFSGRYVLQRTSDWELSATQAGVNGGEKTNITSEAKLLEYATGRATNFNLKVRKNFTHLEFQFVQGSPLLVDIDNWARQTGARSSNSLGSLSITMGPKVRNCRRHDLFIMKDTNTMWGVSEVEVVRSQTGEAHGFAINAQIIDSNYNAFGLPNPWGYIPRLGLR